MEWYLTIGSIRVAVVCLMIFFLIRAGEISLGPLCRKRWVQTIWLLGSICSLIHMLATLGWIHDWSHQQAWESTAAETKALLGQGVGIGIYFNYVFVAIWLFDAAWLAWSTTGYLTRSAAWSWTIYGYLLFITFNGAVVFVSGWFRWLSGAMFVVLAAAWLGRLLRQNNGRD